MTEGRPGAGGTTTRGRGRRLDGLTQIGKYLGISANTVRRWKDLHGLPLHVSDPDSPKPRYWAFTDELDQWQRDRALRPRRRKTSPNAKEQPPSVDRPAPPGPATKSAWIAVLLVFIAVACLGAFFLRRDSEVSPVPSPEPVEPIVEIGTLMDLSLLDVNNHVWAEPFPGEGPILVAALGATDGEFWADNRRLYFLDGQGKVLREPMELSYRKEPLPNYSETFSPAGMIAQDLDGDGYEEILITYGHMPNSPSFTVLARPIAAASHVVYVATGHHRLVFVADLTDDGFPELLFHGPNNLVGYMDALAAVSVREWLVEATAERVPPAVSPNIDWRGNQQLYFYALLPTDVCHESAGCVREADGRLILGGARGVEIDRHGFFDSDPTGPTGSARLQHRMDAWTHLPPVYQLAGQRQWTRALRGLEKAKALAGAARDEELLRWIAIQELRVRAGFEEPEAVEEFARRLDLAATIGDASVFYEIAEAAYLAGRPEIAVRWAERYLDGGPTFGSTARPPWEGLRLLVFALNDLGRTADARAAILRYPVDESWSVVLDRWLRWKLGDPPDPLEELSHDQSDWERYFEWEYRLAHGQLEGFDEGLALELSRSSLSAPFLQGIQAERLAESDPEAAWNLMHLAVGRATRLAQRDEAVLANLPTLVQRCRAQLANRSGQGTPMGEDWC